MTATLLQTKLYLPTPRPDLVLRRRLLQQLLTGLWTGQAFARKLTLVAAPAGFGKTTLILDCGLWTSNPTQPKPAIENLKSGWLSLDEADNNPARFLRYVIAALHSALPEVGRAALPVLESGVPTELEEALAGIINEIAAAACPVILTLDDYHVIHHAGIELLLTFLLDHQPPNLHLIIASRSDPALPLARLRARGQLLELRARDLRFTEEETAAFFTHTMGLTLRPEWIAALEQRTEGWIAGLQLAALSMQGREDTAVQWLKSLPGDLLRQSPPSGVAYGW
jgi:LuxR family maltose regulon positive regulatory protein